MKATLTLETGKTLTVKVNDTELSSLTASTGKRRKPKYGESYWTIRVGVPIVLDWHEDVEDKAAYAAGLTFPTQEECQAEIDKMIALTTLRDSTDFVPDWSDRNKTKWFIYYSHTRKQLFARNYVEKNDQFNDFPMFSTLSAAQQSIETHQKEWLTVFGVKQ